MNTNNMSTGDKLALVEMLATALCYDGETPVDTIALYGQETTHRLRSYAHGIEGLDFKSMMQRLHAQTSHDAYVAADEQISIDLQQFWVLLKALAGEGQRVVRDPFIIYQRTGGVEIMGQNYANGQTWFRSSDYVDDKGEWSRNGRDFAAGPNDRTPGVNNYNHPAYAAYYTPYNAECSCCYLNFPHTEARHQQAIALSHPGNSP